MDEKRQHPVYTDYFVTKDGEIFGPKKKRKPVLDNAGYARFTTYKDGKFKNRSWHRFVWEAF